MKKLTILALSALSAILLSACIKINFIPIRPGLYTPETQDPPETGEANKKTPKK